MNGAEFLLGAAALARHGERDALIGAQESVSFRELALRVQRASAALASLGVKRGDRVLLLLRDTPEFAAAWLGVVRAGAVAVGLNSKLPEADYRHILSDSGATLAIIEDLYVDARPDLSAELARQGRLAVAGAAAAGVPSWREALARAPELAASDAAPDTPAFALYSSGTTGRPKGILHTHGSLAQVGGALHRIGIGEGDRVFATSRLFFAYGLEHGLLAPLALGATSILSSDVPTAQSAINTIAQHRPHALFSVPTLYRRLLAEPAERLAALRAIRRFVSGGERLSPSLVAQWRAATGGELLNLYGMSETFCACIVTPPGTSDGRRTGTPLEGVQLRLVDEAGREPPPGEPGTLWIRHPAQAREYMNLPQQSAAQFKDGWFCTRDMFVRDAAGNYTHQGRSDELVKIAGQWVQPSELEDAVAAEPSIAEAACVAVPDEDGLERLALFVAAAGDGPSALAAAEAACERRLPRHKRPKWLQVVDRLPRTATGKVQRFKLREMLAAKPPPKR